MSFALPKNSWWYLSFASEAAFLGGVIVEAASKVGAVRQASRLGINPGGEALVMAISDDDPLPAPEFRNRLLTVEDLRRAWPGEDVKSIGEFEDEGRQLLPDVMVLRPS